MVTVQAMPRTAVSRGHGTLLTCQAPGVVVVDPSVRPPLLLGGSRRAGVDGGKDNLDAQRLSFPGDALQPLDHLFARTPLALQAFLNVVR